MAILHNSKKVPIELIEYHYRKLFGLSYKEMAEEPIDKIATNLHIERLMKVREDQGIQKNKKEVENGTKRTKI